MFRLARFAAVKGTAVVLPFFAFAFHSSVLQAQNLVPGPTTLTSDNSTVIIDPTSQNGVSSWVVDGQNQMNQQWFWYRVGASGLDKSLDTIGVPTVTQSDPSSLNVLYTSPGSFSVQTVFSLLGGDPGSGTSDLSEQIKISNLSGAPLTFHFFQYSDFNLAGLNNQNVLIEKNAQGLYNEAFLTSGNISVAENIDAGISPGANRPEAAIQPSTLNSLNTIPGYTLSGTTNAGPGRATWALEWDKTISTGGTFLLSKDLNIAGVPEPGTFSLAALGLFTFGFLRCFFGQRRS